MSLQFNISNDGREPPKAMTLTDAAAAHVKSLLAQGGAKAVKIGVKNAGCAGMSYTLDYTNEPAKFDEVVEDKGVTIIIDAKAVMFLLGTEMDYREEKLQSGFVFNNPNVVEACGCGESVKFTEQA